MEDDANWTVWAGGTEVTDFLVTREEAFEIASGYIDEGYDDIAMSNYETDEELTHDQVVKELTKQNSH